MNDLIFLDLGTEANSHIRQYANAKEEDFEAPMKKKLVCDAKKLLAEGHVPKNK